MESKSYHIKLDDLYVAYKKAKAEAFFEKTHYHAVVFTQYEQKLHTNLRKLQARLNHPSPSWFSDLPFLGRFAYLPKSINADCWNNGSGHFRALDPIEDWERCFKETGVKATATFRLIITPTVDFQVISALWILKVGHKFFRSTDQEHCYGHRLRESSIYNKETQTYEQGMNLNSLGLFVPYFSSYRAWRENGLKAMQDSLEAGKSILAITMDVEQFYHRLSPSFLLNEKFLKNSNIYLHEGETQFTEQILKAIRNWYRNTPDYEARPEGAIPVGLSASKIISNVILNDFDKAVRDNLAPIYYGRYVDDVFLVLENEQTITSAATVVQYISDKLQPHVKVVRNTQKKSQPQPSLKLEIDYASDSEIIFSGKKQKVFALSSKHGLDLIHNIREQIRLQSSEHRLLPTLPDSDNEMALRALLATPDATLQADALRKADAVSIRRLGLSLLLKDVEAYADDLDPKSWDSLRNEFYELIFRHALTPQGFFEYFGYIPRVFGLMLASRDLDAASKLIDLLVRIVSILKATTTAGGKERYQFRHCVIHYANALRQSALQAATGVTSRVDKRYHYILKRLKELYPNLRIARSLKLLKLEVHQILLADWGRRPYKDFWYFSQQVNLRGPVIPRQFEVKRRLRLGAIRSFIEEHTDLKTPHWPALAFPTRPLSFYEIGLVAPAVLHNTKLYKDAILLFRGAQVISSSHFGFEVENSELAHFRAPYRKPKDLFTAVVSYETTLTQWEKAARGKPDRSERRYKNLNSLINRALQERNRPTYINFPELSIPRKWALRIAKKLAQNNISFISGVEYYPDRNSKNLRNDCLVSLVTNWPGYKTNTIFFQPKIQPAHAERYALRKLLRKKLRPLFTPQRPFDKPLIYVHGGFCFSVLICSDLTNITNRNMLRGHVDCLFASEWNQDTRTFAALVEATANDLHAYIVQINNRTYGDSRIRAPFRLDYKRDIVQVKGGLHDYYIIGKINYLELRKEQRRTKREGTYKPTPIGYLMSPFRKRRKN